MMQAQVTMQLSHSRGVSWYGMSGMALGLGLAICAAGAHAGGVSWSLGMQTPGVVIGAGNAAPVYVAPAPAYVVAAPVAVYPAPARVYPAPMAAVTPVYGAAWVPPGHSRHRHHPHRWQHGRDGWSDDWRYGRH